MRKIKYKVCILLTIFIAIGCNDSQSENKLKDTIKKDSVINTADEQSEECIFDETAQTSVFLDTVPNFKKLHWIDSTKTAIIPLENNDTLQVKRGGCIHFYFYFTLICHSDNHSFEDQNYWMNKIQFYTKQINDFDNELIDSLWTNKLFEEDINDKQILLNFTQDFYCNQSLRIVKNNDGSVTVELGYYQC